MNATLNTINTQNLPATVKRQLNRLIMEYDPEMIFCSREQVCALPAITVIAGKNMTDRQLEEAQQLDWVRNSIEQHRVMICIGRHHAEYSDLHFSYIVLNCHCGRNEV